MTSNHDSHVASKTADKKGSKIPEVDASGWVCPPPEVMGAYAEERSDGRSVFWIPVEYGYSPANETNLRRWLITKGFIQPGRGSRGQFETVIMKILEKSRVQSAMTIAGCQPGVIKSNGRSVLVTRGPEVIEPDASRPFDELRQIIHGVLGDDPEQIFYFEHWLRIGYLAVKNYSPCVGQALAIAGPRECGKTLLQMIITQVLGGREANPWPWMNGKTHFNHDFIAAEHLQFGDEIGDMSASARRNLAAKIKGLVANPSQRLEAKGKDAMVVAPFWRISMTVNDEPEYLAVIPPLDESVKDKIMLLKASPAPFLKSPVWMDMERKQRIALVRDQLPGYLAHLLALPPIPTALRNGRTGIKSYHNAELATLLSAVSNEGGLLELVDLLIFKDDSLETKDGFWTGTGTELEGALYNRCARYETDMRKTISKVLSFPSAAGSFLNRLSQGVQRDRVIRKTVNGKHIYKITTDKKYVPREFGSPYLRPKAA
jgi:hypothetical protein